MGRERGLGRERRVLVERKRVVLEDDANLARILGGVEDLLQRRVDPAAEGALEVRVLNDGDECVLGALEGRALEAKLVGRVERSARLGTRARAFAGGGRLAAGGAHQAGAEQRGAEHHLQTKLLHHVRTLLKESVRDSVCSLHRGGWCTEPNDSGRYSRGRSPSRPAGLPQHPTCPEAVARLTGQVRIGRHRAPVAGVAEWQTRRTQNPLSLQTCGFDPHLRYFFPCPTVSSISSGWIWK